MREPVKESSPDPGSMSRLAGRAASPWERGLLAILLVWAFGLRLWFARTGLNSNRFVDEVYILENVGGFLKDHSLRPLQLYYPALGNLIHSLWLGAADAIARWTGRGGETIFRDDQFTPAAYLLSRGLQSGVGMLTIYWTYRIGRRLLSPRMGLLAALALAAVPLHVRLSAMIKPDILLLLGLLIAAEATAVALTSGRLRDFAGAGAAVGLATSGKYNGVAAALPLALLALPGARRQPAVVARMAAAAGAALLAFVLIDPFFFPMLGEFKQEFSHTLSYYQTMSGASGYAPSHLGVFLATAPMVLDPGLHGLFTGLLGFAGLLCTAVWAWRRRGGRDSLLALLALFPLTYMILYAATTVWVKKNNYLPVCPFIALGAAALVCEAGRRLHGKAARVFTVAVAAWCLALIWRPMAYAYDQTVATTLDRAEEALSERLAPLAGSRVLYQIGALDRLVWVGESTDRAVVQDFDRIGLAPVRGLDLADAEIYTSAALARPAAAGRVAAARRSRQIAQIVRIEPWLFRAQGEPLTLLVHPWTAAGDPVELAVQPPAPGGTGDTWTARIPAGPRFPALASFEVIVPSRTDPPEELMADGKRLPLLPAGRHGRRCLTERVLLDRAPAELALPGLPAAGQRPPRLRLLLWKDR